MSHAILLIHCKDQKGITAKFTDFVFRNNGNIVHADQHIDDQEDMFFMRLEWSLDGFNIKPENIAKELHSLIQEFNVQYQLYFTKEKANIALFVSKHLHCLYDLLYRYKEGELNCHIPLMISNHMDAQDLAKQFGIEYHCLPKTPGNKSDQEKLELELLRKHDVQSIVLARYHQILSERFVNEYTNEIINIHHSFLPAFAGKNPYRQAFTRGVKLIGATCHYVTKDLDQGPIIAQDTVHISHRHSLKDLVSKGEDLEKSVLHRGLKWHLDRKILSYNDKTVIFD